MLLRGSISKSLHDDMFANITIFLFELLIAQIADSLFDAYEKQFCSCLSTVLGQCQSWSPEAHATPGASWYTLGIK